MSAACFLSQADVLVNSTSTDLQMAVGPVEKAIAKEAGPKLLRECRRQFPKGITVNGFAATDSFNMTNAKRIYHVALSRDNFPVSCLSVQMKGKYFRVRMN